MSDRLQRLRGRLHAWAAALSRDVLTLWFSSKHPATPWRAKLVAGLVAGYALSPIDLIPDFIPVIGYLDDLLLVPAGIWLAVQLIPAPVLLHCRAQAQDWLRRQRAAPHSRIAAVVILLFWAAALAAISAWAWHTLNPA